MSSSSDSTAAKLRLIALWLGVSLMSFAPAARVWSQTSGRQVVTGKIVFNDVAGEAGITSRTIYGGELKNKYLLETTGCGAAFIDFDNDGWQDIFLVGGTRLEGSPKELISSDRLYRNNRNGTFQDVTRRAGIKGIAWGQSVSVGDYDNDGFDDLFIARFGTNSLYRNNGNLTFTDVAIKAGVATNKTRWGSGSAFFDYDRDGQLDLFVASYIDLDLKTAPLPETGPCLYKGITVACGPPGLTGGVNQLYRNRGDGTFENVSEKSGIAAANGTYALGVLVSDFNNDGWSDVYVANDSSPAALYLNNRNGTFTDIGIEAGCAYSADGKPQAGMGVSAADYDRDGWLDIIKTNFSGDTSSLYRNVTASTKLKLSQHRATAINTIVNNRPSLLRTSLNNTAAFAKLTTDYATTFDDVTFAAGLGINTRWLGWGCGFMDFDNDGWQDIFIVNGHVYPEAATLKTEAGYAQRKILYRNLRNGRFEDVTERFGGALTQPVAGRGAAFGDYDNDGDLDVLINPVNAVPELVRTEVKTGNNFIIVKTIGTKSNRNGIGARVTVTTDDGTQMNEVRSGGSYYSSNDLRLHFGLGTAATAKSIEVRWLGGATEVIKDVAANQVVKIKEGSGLVK